MSVELSMFGAFAKAAIAVSNNVARTSADKRHDWFDFRSGLLFGFDEEVGKSLEAGLRRLHESVRWSPTSVPEFDAEFDFAREELSHLRQKWHHEWALKTTVRRTISRWFGLKPSLPDALDDLIAALDAVSLRWRVIDSQSRMYKANKTSRQSREARTGEFDPDEKFFEYAERVEESHKLFVPLVKAALDGVVIVREAARKQIARQKL